MKDLLALAQSARDGQVILDRDLVSKLAEYEEAQRIMRTHLAKRIYKAAVDTIQEWTLFQSHFGQGGRLRWLMSRPVALVVC